MICIMKSTFLSAIFHLGEKRLTQRAADGGDEPRFSSLFLASAESRSRALSTLRPTAANAHR